jgi:PhnB protein
MRGGVQVFTKKLSEAKIEAILIYEGTSKAQRVPAEWRKRVMHALLTVNVQVLMGSDVPPAVPGGGYQKPQGFSVSFNTREPAEADRVFAALAEDGQVDMPIQETFSAARFGTCVDRFGSPWMINCDLASASALR